MSHLQFYCAILSCSFITTQYLNHLEQSLMLQLQQTDSASITIEHFNCMQTLQSY